MYFAGLLFVLSLVHSSVNGFGFHGFHFEGLEDPQSLGLNETHEIREAYIEQPLDHFNARDNRTWLMRYLENSGYYKKNGPILIMIGGEWTISRGFLESGLMHELGSAHGAMMYYTEHRYYGKSLPTEDTSSENLQYLGVEQALADLAYFIETKKKEEELRHSRVIVFGGSYAGSMAAWLRLKYPHLVLGALASSAPVFAKADFYEYYEVVTKSLGRYSQNCSTNIKEAFDMVEELLKATDGPEKLKSYFNLCDVPDVHSSSDVGFFMNLLAEKFAGIVQYDKVQNGTTKIAFCCETMTSASLGNPVQRLARFVSKPDKCLENSYENFLKLYKDVSWHTKATNSSMRQWYYQTCTEYGYYQTTNSKECAFGTLFPLNYFTDMCVDLYGKYYNEKFLDGRIRRTNIMYGGLRPDLTNVIFTNGNIDPWHSLSVLEDLNRFSPAILIDGSSHCRDLYPDAKTDVKGLTKARAKLREIIGKWMVS
ncbi:hypothetical protein KM043_010532 [Ampulex compressa]|nr:hypothetical protein KM043_010532 [Ampulex compressa]